MKQELRVCVCYFRVDICAQLLSTKSLGFWEDYLVLFFAKHVTDGNGNVCLFLKSEKCLCPVMFNCLSLKKIQDQVQLFDTMMADMFGTYRFWISSELAEEINLNTPK